MSLLIAAAIFQAAPALEADTYQAALRCRRAIVTGIEALPIAVTAQFNYFTMTAARAMPGDADYFARMRSAMAPDAGPAAMRREEAAALLGPCDQRFPLARRTAPPALPADDFERDMICAGAASQLAGAARGYGERTGDTAPYQRLQALAARYQGRVLPALAAHGLGDAAAARRAIGEQMFASLDVGNQDAIANACEAQPPAR